MALFANDPMTQQEAVQRAHGIASLVRTSVAATEKERRQSEEVIQAIKHSGLVRLLMPRSQGGYELSFDTFVETILEIARVDASAGWCYSLLLSHSWLLAHFPQEAQQAVWKDSPDVLLATSFFPAARLTEVEGGYLLSGNWPWLSAIDACEWAMLAGLVPASNPEQRPDVRLCLIPKSQYHVEDTWFVAGLRGSGSKNVLAQDIFVPYQHTLSLTPIRQGKPAEHLSNPGPLYSLPLNAAFATALAAPIVGAARGAYEAWKESSQNKYTALSHELVATFSHQHIRMAEAAVEIDAAELLLRRALDVIRAGGPLSEAMRIRNRRDYAYCADFCVRAVERLFTHSGGGAHFDTHPLQRYWRDIHAMAAHAVLNVDACGDGFGRYEFGLPPNPRDPNA